MWPCESIVFSWGRSFLDIELRQTHAFFHNLKCRYTIASWAFRIVLNSYYLGWIILLTSCKYFKALLYAYLSIHACAVCSVILMSSLPGGVIPIALINELHVYYWLYTCILPIKLLNTRVEISIFAIDLS